MNNNTAEIIDLEEVRLKAGGPGGGEGNWLSKLPEGTRFLGKFERDLTPFLVTFTILKHRKNSCLLDMEGFNMDTVVAVDPVIFCRAVIKYDILEEDGEQEK